ncbi:MAG TPA: S24 family peptidase, partial [Bryobacteraceae bacterium]|nr:S24 family peptidase [Bryobacteraceae bacterium]
VYSVVEIALPGSPVENAGVLLVDPDTDKCHYRFRPDLSDLSEDDAELLEALPQDLETKASEWGALKLLDWLQENASNFIRTTDPDRVMVDSFDKTLNRLYKRHITPKVIPFRTHLPLYSVEAAAGKWGRELEVDESEPNKWLEAPGDLRLTEDMFVAYVTGRSMEPRIPAGSLCVFRGGSALAGSRQGKLVLVLNYGEPGENRFTIKRYRSTKHRTEEGWAHEKIVLEPLNPEYEAWELDENARIRVVGEFVRVLETPDED